MTPQGGRSAQAEIVPAFMKISDKTSAGASASRERGPENDPLQNISRLLMVHFLTQR